MAKKLKTAPKLPGKPTGKASSPKAPKQARALKEAPSVPEQASEAPAGPVVQPAPVDPTPQAEAASQVPEGVGQIDGSGIGTNTNQDVIDNFPKNDQGQVVIEDGRIVGLSDEEQPLPSAFE